MLIALNMSPSVQNVSLDVAAYGITSAKANVLLSTMGSNGGQTLAHLVLEPFAVYIAKIEK